MIWMRTPYVRIVGHGKTSRRSLGRLFSFLVTCIDNDSVAKDRKAENQILS